ncbi:MAG: ATP-binding cassette, subfamily bacterial [Streptosporangiaceae bacterium]|nr:ATP-binding cassette, subfamily bacterial [Streptosporangiaceae bacterium]
MYGSSWHAMRSYYRDSEVTRQRLKPGTVRRIITYARPYRRELALFLGMNALAAVFTVAVPLLMKTIIDQGILARNTGVVIAVASVVAGLALASAVLSFATRWYSAKIGEGLIYDLRTEVFSHVQRQPIAFFTRAQTGSLVSRLNSDVIGAQQALTSTLAAVVSNALTLILVLIAMLSLSWLVTVITLVMIPAFVIPARLVGRRLQRLTRESMQLDAAMGSTMTERFNVAGAMLVKLFGKPGQESETFAGRAARVRDIGVVTAMYGGTLFIALTLLASMATAVVYGVGGTLVIHHAFQIGTLVALTALLARLYGPITALSNVQVDVMTALVSFDRVFEVLDLKPLIQEKPGAVALRTTTTTTTAGGDGQPGSAPAVDFRHVSFHYPAASEVSLASLESIALATPERTGPAQPVLRGVTFQAPPGQLTALVGPSGAGKTTITHLVSRLYDPDEGAVLIGGQDLRDVTLDSLHDVVGVVTQDAHMFHDTIRANLSYARPEATEADLAAACQAAQIWDLITALPDGLDTVVGDRGYRLSGGEKQRLAIARLLLKAPSVVVLDEATAHLDSESEAAVQAALRTALTGRTSLVIAHRLSTIREADQILVIDQGQVRERGSHEDLLAAGGLYAELYHTQFAGQEPAATP